MNATALALVLTGALLHASWNVLAKKASGGLAFVWLFGLVSLVIMIPFGLQSWRSDPQQFTVQTWIAIVGSALVHVAYSLSLQKGYQEADFSIVYPTARGSGPLFAVLGAVVLLRESPTFLGWLGVSAILVGIFLLSGAGRTLIAPPERVRRGVIWGGITGLSIAAYTLIDAWAVKIVGVSPVLYYALGLCLRTAILAPQALRRPQALLTQWQRNGGYIAAVGVLSPIAYILVLYAMTLAPVSYVAPVRELSMLIAVLFAVRLLRESFVPLRILGTACIVAGVIALSRA